MALAPFVCVSLAHLIILISFQKMAFDDARCEVRRDLNGYVCPHQRVEHGERSTRVEEGGGGGGHLIATRDIY